MPPNLNHLQERDSCPLSHSLPLPNSPGFLNVCVGQQPTRWIASPILLAIDSALEGDEYRLPESKNLFSLQIYLLSTLGHELVLCTIKYLPVDVWPRRGLLKEWGNTFLMILLNSVWHPDLLRCVADRQGHWIPLSPRFCSTLTSLGGEADREKGNIYHPHNIHVNFKCLTLITACLLIETIFKCNLQWT